MEIVNYDVGITFDYLMSSRAYKFKTHTCLESFLEGLKYMYHRDNDVGYANEWGVGNYPMSHIQASVLSAPEYESYMLGINEAARHGTMGFKIV